MFICSGILNAAFAFITSFNEMGALRIVFFCAFAICVDLVEGRV